MFELLTRILLWLLIATFFYYVLVRFIPRQYLTWFGGLILFTFVVLAFINPNQRLVSEAWSILSFPFKPLGLSLVLLMSAVRQGAKKVVGNQVVAALLILLLSSVPILAYNLAVQAQREAIQVQQPRPAPAQTTTPAIPRAAAIVVLGRTAEENLPLSGTDARLVDAADIYQQQADLGTPPLVIVNSNIDANRIRRVLGRLGVPETQVVIEPRSTDLRGTAVEVESILRTRGINDRSIIVVSPALNSGRAIRTFANVGITVTPRSTDFNGSLDQTAGRLRVENFIPNMQALSVTTRVVEEYLASIYYFLRGWLVPALT